MNNKITIARFEQGTRYAAEELGKKIIDLTIGTGANGSVIGLSGGIDSSTVAYLCNYARKNFDNSLEVYGVVMPSSANNPKDKEDGLRIANNLGIEAIVVPIEPIAKKFVEGIPGINDEFNRGNLYSETRAVVLSRVAAAKNCRVMGTGNWDEDYVLGYFTKRGDGAVDNNILGNLPKRLVRELATYLGIPKDIVNRVPTAGLWSGQTDESELGYSYEQAEIIQRGYDLGLDEKEITGVTGYSLESVRNVAFRHSSTEHKRQSPPVGRVSLSYEELEAKNE